MSPKMRTPALLHSTCTAPNSAYAASASACTDAKSDTSVCTAIARAPLAVGLVDATARAASSSMSAITMFIPAPAELEHDRAADAAPAAGDDGRPSTQIVHGVLAHVLV